MWPAAVVAIGVLCILGCFSAHHSNLLSAQSNPVNLLSSLISKR